MLRLLSTYIARIGNGGACKGSPIALLRVLLRLFAAAPRLRGPVAGHGTILRGGVLTHPYDERLDEPVVSLVVGRRDAADSRHLKLVDLCVLLQPLGVVLVELGLLHQ